MIEKASIIRQVGRFAKRQALQAAHDISQMRQCREAASSKGRSRRVSQTSLSVELGSFVCVMLAPDSRPTCVSGIKERL